MGIRYINVPGENDVPEYKDVTNFDEVCVRQSSDGAIYGVFPNGITFPICKKSMAYCKRIASLTGLPAIMARESINLSRRYITWKNETGRY